MSVITLPRIFYLVYYILFSTRTIRFFLPIFLLHSAYFVFIFQVLLYKWKILQKNFEYRATRKFSIGVLIPTMHWIAYFYIHKHLRFSNCLRYKSLTSFKNQIHGDMQFNVFRKDDFHLTAMCMIENQRLN